MKFQPRTPPTTTTTTFEDEDLTIAQTLVKMRSHKDKEKGKGVAFRAAQEESARPTRILLTIDPKEFRWSNRTSNIKYITRNDYGI
ncbi:hypothetical protein Tco_0025610 [Tanacetum coccineum]